MSLSNPIKIFRPLATGYTRKAYISNSAGHGGKAVSSSEAYINGFDITFNCNSVAQSELFGAGTQSFYFKIDSNLHFHFYFPLNGSSADIDLGAADTNTHSLSFRSSITTKLIKFDGVEIQYPSSYVAFHVRADYFALFGVQWSGTIYNCQTKYYLYYFKAYDNDTVTYEKIPAINSSDEIGMYDYVSSTFRAFGTYHQVGPSMISYSSINYGNTQLRQFKFNDRVFWEIPGRFTATIVINGALSSTKQVYVCKNGNYTFYSSGTTITLILVDTDTVTYGASLNGSSSSLIELGTLTRESSIGSVTFEEQVRFTTPYSSLTVNANSSVTNTAATFTNKYLFILPTLSGSSINVPASLTSSFGSSNITIRYRNTARFDASVGANSITVSSYTVCY